MTSKGSRPGTAPGLYALQSVGTLKGPILFQVQIHANQKVLIYFSDILHVYNLFVYRVECRTFELGAQHSYSCIRTM